MAVTRMMLQYGPVSFLPNFLICFALVVQLPGLSGAASAAEGLPPDRFEAGLVTFALATGNIVPVLPLKDSLRGESAPYLRALLLIESGQVDEGVSALDAVVQSGYHRGEAALVHARILAEAGKSDEAVNWYELAENTGFGEIRQEARFALADLARQANQPEAAGKILASMQAGYWAAVGYLNLANDFASTDLNPSRALVALRVALAMTEKDSNEERARDLRGRLLVRAGQLAYVSGDYDKAIGFLKRVPLDSYRAPQALYLHGLALSERGNYREAMQSWHRAKKFPMAYPGVADAWIGMGRGYDLAGYLGQSGEAFLAASAAYESERVTLRRLRDRVREIGAYKALVEDARNIDEEWFLADSRTLTQPRMAYLFGFMDAPLAQRTVAQVAELEDLLTVLEQQSRDLTVFIVSIDDFLGGKAKTQAGSMRVKRSEAKQLLATSRSLISEVKQARDVASSELDIIALDYIARQDQRMAFALNKADQQVAHLYEYLALRKLEEQSP
ncbi:hypothetical protein FWJ25_06845 [Marinobacter salinexigens]|uniref:Uncharacterized protein n=1 Tax=Marinobacter salinexigens TaxID=2919747 RepID=A0A5B0VK36_9GAMM|nr:hypothetical protein [Marinobacter salinexigens]KAA1175080.1 hypothetical protein FWJ25_06845 [Marinobacter salinexigens]